MIHKSSTKMQERSTGTPERDTGPTMHPNGGGSRPFPGNTSKMPEAHKGKPYTSGKLAVDLPKMPRQNRAERQTEPRRK